MRAVRPREREEGGHDRRHAGVEDGGIAPAGFERHDLVFENLGVGMREAGVDQVGALAVLGLDLARGDGEGVLGRLRAGEDVSGTAKDRRPRRADG